jgi:hypothetical protein
MQAHLSKLPAGEAGTDATVREIGRLVGRAVENPNIRVTAISIVRQAGADVADPFAVASTLFDWVRANIDYLPDPVGVESVQAPCVTMQFSAGDCDDHTVLVASLAMSLGIEARYRVTGNSADRFEHVWPELKINGQWIPADTTETDRLGTPIRTLSVVKTYNVEGKAMYDLGAPAAKAGISRPLLERTAYNAAMQSLNRQWASGSVTLDVLENALSLIKAGNYDLTDTAADVPVRKAYEDFIREVKRQGGLGGGRGLGNPVAIGGAIKSVGGVVSGVGSAIGSLFGGSNEITGAPGGNMYRSGGHGYGWDSSGVAIDRDYHNEICSLIRLHPEAINSGCPWKESYAEFIDKDEFLWRTGRGPEPTSIAKTGAELVTAGGDMLSNPLVLAALGVGAFMLLKKKGR